MAITRRKFLQYSAATGAGVLFGVFDFKPIVAYASANPPVWTSEAITVCGYCSVGCSMIAGNSGGYVTYMQGNPDSPINKGALCSKGMASAQFSTIVSDDSGTRIPHPDRLTQPLKRNKITGQWDTIDWITAISEIAAKVKATRDAPGAFIETDGGGIKVNRCQSIGVLGGSSLNNEAAYLMAKLYRALGVVYLETQARN